MRRNKKVEKEEYRGKVKGCGEIRKNYRERGRVGRIWKKIEGMQRYQKKRQRERRRNKK